MMEASTTPTASSTTLERIRPLILPSDGTPEVIDLTQEEEAVRHVSDAWNDTFEEEEEEERATTIPMSVDVDLNWPIHQGYACYTLYDVVVETDLVKLEQWLKLFTPSSQPRSEEEFLYVQCMASAISEKIQLLKSRS